MSTVEQCAELIHQANLLSNESGVLVAVPIPDHAAKLGMEIEDAIQEALVEAKLIHLRNHFSAFQSFSFL